MDVKCDYYCCHGKCQGDNERDSSKVMKDCHLTEISKELQELYVRGCKSRKNDSRNQYV